MKQLDEKFNNFLDHIKKDKIEDVFYGNMKRINKPNTYDKIIRIRKISDTSSHYDIDEIYCNKFMIPYNSKWKHIFDFFVQVIIAYSCTVLVYKVSFYENDGQHENDIIEIILNSFIELIFTVSIILNFFQEYVTDSLEIVRSYKKIAYNYVIKGLFILDFITIIPFDIFINYDSHLIKLLRIIRLKKLIEFFNLKKIDIIVETFFSGNKREKINVSYKLTKLFKIIRFFVLGLFLTYYLGCFWYLYCRRISQPNNEKNFIDSFKFDILKDPFNKLLKSSYFILTTLTTVGYGDLFAINNTERQFAYVIMLLGVVIFSYVLGNFSDLITLEDRRQGAKDIKNTNLQNWLNYISMKNKRFDSGFMYKIYKHYTYVWDNDRNESINKNDHYMKTMSKGMRYKLMSLLWQDIFKLFSSFFFYNKINKKKYPDFYYYTSFCFEPKRFYHDDIIYSANKEIDEFYFILEGFVEIGYSIYYNIDDVNYVKTVKSGDVIGDFYCIYNCRSKYYYKAKSSLSMFSISKRKFNNILSKIDDLKDKIKLKSFLNYKENIRNFVEERFQEEYNPGLNNYDILNKNRRFSKFDVLGKINESNAKNKLFVNLKKDDINLAKYLWDSSCDFDNNIQMSKYFEEVKSIIDKNI